MANLYDVTVTKTWKSAGSGPSVLRAQTASYIVPVSATSEANAMAAAKTADINGSDNSYDFSFHVRIERSGIIVGS